MVTDNDKRTIRQGSLKAVQSKAMRKKLADLKTLLLATVSCEDTAPQGRDRHPSGIPRGVGGGRETNGSGD